MLNARFKSIPCISYTLLLVMEVLSLLVWFAVVSEIPARLRWSGFVLEEVERKSWVLFNNSLYGDTLCISKLFCDR